MVSNGERERGNSAFMFVDKELMLQTNLEVDHDSTYEQL